MNTMVEEPIQSPLDTAQAATINARAIVTIQDPHLGK
jgi:hypothetical protein